MLQLTRASLALSPLADVLAGAATAHAGGAVLDASAIAAAATAGTACFVFGMTLNDVADRAKDAVTSPTRPLPSGRIGIGFARGLVVVSALVAWIAAARLPGPAQACVVAMLVLISAYDLLPKHGGFAGVLLLAAIRGLDLLLGGAAIGVDPATVIAAIGYALFIGSIAMFARMEDGEVPYSRQSLLRATVGIAVASIAAPLAIASSGAAAGNAYVLLAVAIATLGVGRWWRAVAPLLRTPQPELAALRRCVGVGLSGLYAFDAAVAFCCGAIGFAATIGAAFVATRLLVRRFPPS